MSVEANMSYGSAAAASEKSAMRRVLSSAAIGQFVEWYDFVIYAYSATIIAKLFFPNSDPTAALLSTFAVYAVGFIMRPLGGFLFGSLGDRFGRQKILSFVILLMGCATVGIGLLPTYAQIGILAPILLVVCRLIQGLSAAGETIGSNSFVAEHAPADKRGLYVAFTWSFAVIPPIVAALLVLGLTNSMTPEAYGSWGWRIPFLISGPLALVGLYIRNVLEESPAFKATKAAKRVTTSPISEAMRSQKRQMAYSFGLTAFSALSFYTFVGYFVSYLTTTVGLTSNDALISNSIGLSIACVTMIVSGGLSDRFGRKPILILGLVVTALSCVPAYLIAAQGNLVSAIIGQGMLAISCGLYWGPVGIALMELFPTRTRFSASAISYNVAYTIFGGTAPFVGTWMVLQSGSKIAPAIYMAVVSVIVFFVVLAIPETSRRSMIHKEDIAEA